MKAAHTMSAVAMAAMVAVAVLGSAGVSEAQSVARRRSVYVAGATQDASPVARKRNIYFDDASNLTRIRIVWFAKASNLLRGR